MSYKKVICINNFHIFRGGVKFDYISGCVYLSTVLLYHMDSNMDTLRRHGIYTNVEGISKEFLGYIDSNVFERNFVDYDVYHIELINVDRIFNTYFK